MTVTTRCGNQYSDKEWADMMGNWAAEVAQAQDEMEAESITCNAAIDMMVATGLFEGSTRNQLRAAVSSNWNVEFSSQAKADAVLPIFNWYNQEVRKIQRD